MLGKDECKQFALADEEQIVTELEALGVLTAISQWNGLLSRKHPVCFLDNEGARRATLRGRSNNSLLNTVARRVCEAEDAYCVFSWCARIPSSSNLADPPSSLRLKSCFCLGGVVFRFGLPNSGDVGRCHGR